MCFFPVPLLILFVDFSRDIKRKMIYTFGFLNIHVLSLLQQLHPFDRDIIWWKFVSFDVIFTSLLLLFQSCLSEHTSNRLTVLFHSVSFCSVFCSVLILLPRVFVVVVVVVCERRRMIMCHIIIHWSMCGLWSTCDYIIRFNCIMYKYCCVCAPVDIEHLLQCSKHTQSHLQSSSWFFSSFSSFARFADGANCS